MRLTIERTDTITEVNGAAARVWKGTTEGGVACLVFVVGIAAEKAHDNSEFAREMRPMDPPKEMRPLAQVLSLRSVL